MKLSSFQQLMSRENRICLDSETRCFLKEKCNLFEYQITTIENAMQRFEFQGKTVLEVGGSNLPRQCVFDILGAKKWVCIDLIENYQLSQNKDHYERTIFLDINDKDLLKKIDENDYVIIQTDIADMGKHKLKEVFDICFSICSFEHIHKLNLSLTNIYSSLKDNGVLFSEFGPIFSCKYGSHYWYDDDSNFNRQEEILDYKHLLMDNMELLEFLLENFPQEKANAIHHDFLASERINRLFYEDYEKLMGLSKFKKYNIEPAFRIEVDKAVLNKLTMRYPNYKNFDIYSVRLFAQKS